MSGNGKLCWPTVELGEVCAFENGDRGKNYPGRKALVPTGIPFINAGHIQEGTIDWNEMDFIPEHRFDLLGSGKIRQSDILYCLRGSLGKFGVVERSCKGAIASSLVIVRSSERLHVDFLAYYFRSPLSAAMVEKFAGGAAQPNLSAKSLSQYILPLPPLEEQKRIVAVLDQAFAALDRARANAEANLADAEELFARDTSSLFSEISTSSRRTKLVSEIAQKRKGSIRTGPFGSQLKHSEFVDQGIKVLGIDNAVQNRFVSGKPRFITEEKYEALKRYTVFPGDVIITIMGTCGRCAVIPDDIPLSINTKHLCCITLDAEVCVPEYLYRYFLLSPTARAYLEANAKGSVMDGLNMGIIKELPVELPELETQNEVCARVADLEKQTSKLATRYQSHITDLEDLRQSILQKAFAGELT